MNAPCCSLRRTSRTRKIVFSTTPLMMTTGSRTPEKSKMPLRQSAGPSRYKKEKRNENQPGAQRNKERDRFVPACDAHLSKL